MRSEGYGSSVRGLPHLRAINRSTNDTTYSSSDSAWHKGRKICGAFSESAAFGVKKERKRQYANLGVYLEGTRSHSEGRVSTPACYLLL